MFYNNGYGQQPQYAGGYQQPAMTPTQQNVVHAINSIQPAIQNLLAQGMINQYEANSVMQEMSQPMRRAALEQRIATMYNGPMAPQYILSEVTQMVMNTVQRYRNPNAGAYQAAPRAYGNPQTYYNAFQSAPAPAGLVNIADSTYGAQLRQNAQVNASNASAPNANAPARAQTPNPGLTTQAKVPASMPTNTPYDVCPRLDDMPKPIWKPLGDVSMIIDSVDGQKLDAQFIHSIMQIYAGYEIVISPDATQMALVWRNAEPASNAKEAIDFVERVKKENNHESDIDIIDYDELVPVDSPAHTSITTYTEARKEFLTKPSAASAVSVTDKLRSKGTFGAQLTQILLGLFNRSASVAFMRVFNNGQLARLPNIEDGPMLGHLLMDTGNTSFDSWKEDEKAFGLALKESLTGSYSAVFNKVSKGFIDINNPKQKDLLLVKYYNELGIPGGLTTVMARDRTPEMEQTIVNLLGKLTVLRVKKRVCVHHLQIPELAIGSKNVSRIQDQTSYWILEELFKRYGSMDLIDPSDPSQFLHPYRLGCIYGGMLIVRRM